MALDGTYAGLQASIAGWLHRSDMTTVITSDLIVLAEARIARDLRLRKQVVLTTLSTVSGTQTVALPSDYLETENLSIVIGGIDRQIPVVNIEYLNFKYPDGSGNGEPAVYAMEGDNLLFGPTPDGAYSIPFYYYQKFPALSVTPTNWLLTNHPNVYLFGALAEAGDYTKSVNTEKWESKYAQSVKSLQDADTAATFSGSALRVRAK